MEYFYLPCTLPSIQLVLRQLQLYPAVGLGRLDTGYIQLIDIVGMDEPGVSIFGVVTYCVNDMRGGEWNDGSVV